MAKLIPCPKCGCPDELELDSSSIANASWVDCHYCDFRLQEPVPEETIVEIWNRLDRGAMPSFEEEY